MSSLYFVNADKDTIETIIKDMSPPAVRLESGRKGPAYADAYLFFSGEVSPNLFEQLAASPAAPHIKGLVETYLNFIAVESRAYHLGFDGAQFGRVFRERPLGTDALLAGASRDFDLMAAQIVGAQVTMGQIPMIRYQKTSAVALKLASLVQERLDAYVQRNPAFQPARDGQLVIMDRTIDLLAPLLHEFTLQAMANDLLEIEDGTKYSYKYASGSAESRRQVILDESDFLWDALRHSHIAEVSKEIIRRFNEFMSENKAAQHAEGGQVTDLKQLRETMGAMAEFQELKSVYSLHLSVAQECLAVFEKRKLIDVAAVEQIMAIGTDPDGEKVANVWAMMTPLFAIPAVTSAERARLVMLYMLTQPPLSEAEKKALFEHAKLGTDELESVRQLAILAQKAPAPCTQRKPGSDGKRGGRKDLLQEDFPFDASRYVAAVKMILDDLANGGVDEGEFPLLKPGAAGASAAKPAGITSLRARTSIPSGAAPGSGKGSISAFIIGGMTYSEMRSVYELSARNDREFFIGGDRILTPESFLDILRL